MLHPSITFIDNSYCLQDIYIVSFIHSIHRSVQPLTGHQYHVTGHPLSYMSFILFPRSSIPFYRPSIPFTDPSYHLQVVPNILQTIHGFADHSYHLQVIHTISQTIHGVNRSFILFSGHPYHFRDHS